MKIGALVPATGPGLNKEMLMQSLNGKPLLAWTIDTLLESDCFDNITLVYDSPATRDTIARYYSPSDLHMMECNEDISALEMAIQYLNHNAHIGFLGYFLPIYPFRKVETLIEIDRHVRSRYPWRIVSETTDKQCTSDYYYPKGCGLKKIFSHKPLFCPVTISTYLYWDRYCLGSSWSRYHLAASERLLRIPIKTKEATKLHSQYQLKQAENFIKNGCPRPQKLIETPYNDWSILSPEGLDVERFIKYIGPEKLESQDHPILIVEKASYQHARFLDIPEIVGPAQFMNLDAIKHVHMGEYEDLTTDLSQLPDEYISSPAYRLFRNPPDKTGYWTMGFHNDINGVHFGTRFGENNTTEPDYETGIFPDIISWENVIMLDDLKKQPFYIDPYNF